MSDIHQLAPKPPGVLPRNTQYVLLGVIAALVLGLSFCGSSMTQKGTKKQAEAAIVSTTTRQEEDFRAMIKAQNEADLRRQQMQERLRQAQVAHQERQQPVARQYSRPERDPAEELERQRRARAPFAPVMVIVAKETGQQAAKEVQPQIVYRAGNGEDPASSAKPENLPKATGSGIFLPEREGNLFRIYEGSLVRTILVNRLDGTFTGPVMCIVAEPVVAKDKVILIPAGAKFLGEARRVEDRNQQRLAVWFDRLLLPNGYSIPLEKTPGLNNFGETGLKDKVNNHYLRRFTFAGAIGLLSGLRLYGGRPEPFGFESGVIASAGSVASSDLQRRTSDVPTITIREGHAVNVYLANDLLVPEYSGVKGN